MQNSTSHPQDVSPTEARQGRRRTGLLTVMGAGIALALGGMLVVYLRWARTLFVADLVSPGREAQNPLLARELLNAIEYLQLNVDNIVGAHGRGAWSMDDLRKVALPLADPKPLPVTVENKE